MEETLEKKKRYNFLASCLKTFLGDAPVALLEKLPLGPPGRSPLTADPKEILLAHQEFLQRMHYSWWAEVIEKETVPIQKAYLSLLPEEKRKKCLKLLHLKSAKPFDHEVMPQVWIYQQLEKAFSLEEKLPICFLPQSPFHYLLTMEKEELVLLMDLLVLPQLTKQIRQIVDRNRLVRIYEALTPLQKQFLKEAMQAKHITLEPSIDLMTWSGDQKELRRSIHKAGLVFLAKAVSKEESTFLFYLTHLLDKGRGTLLAKSLETEEVDHLAAYQQLVHHSAEFLGGHRG